jgi:hypothetical protein
MIGSMFATIVDWDALGKVVVYSLIAVIGVTLTFSLTIVGATRFADMRREDRPVEAALFAALAAIGLAVSVGAIVLGIVVMTNK